MTTETDTFKLGHFKEFPLEELDKIRIALKNLGYIGHIYDNGNIGFRKVKNNE